MPTLSRDLILRSFSLAERFINDRFSLRSAAMAVLRELREHYSKPAFTPSEFVLDLTAKG